MTQIKVKEKYGFIDRTGKMVIAPQFDDAQSFSEGLAPVKVGKKWGYINNVGSYVIYPQFDFASVFNDGLAPVNVEFGIYGYIDKNGKIVIDSRQYRDKSSGLVFETEPFKNGIAIFPSMGIAINKEGKIIWKARNPPN